MIASFPEHVAERISGDNYSVHAYNWLTKSNDSNEIMITGLKRKNKYVEDYGKKILFMKLMYINDEPLITGLLKVT